MKSLTEQEKQHVERVLFDPDEKFGGHRPDLLRTTEELHYYALLWNWDDNSDDIFPVIRNPLCDKGTALLVYWLTDPVSFFEKNASPEEMKDGDEYERGYFDLISEIQQRMVDGFYTIETIAIDPEAVANEETRSDKLKKAIPEIMYQPSPGEPFSED